MEKTYKSKKFNPIRSVSFGAPQSWRGGGGGVDSAALLSIISEWKMVEPRNFVGMIFKHL